VESTPVHPTYHTSTTEPPHHISGWLIAVIVIVIIVAVIIIIVIIYHFWIKKKRIEHPYTTQYNTITGQVTVDEEIGNVKALHRK